MSFVKVISTTEAGVTHNTILLNKHAHIKPSENDARQ